MRIQYVTRGLVTVAAVMAGIITCTGCAGNGSATPGTAKSSTGTQGATSGVHGAVAAPQLTVGQASQVFTSFLPRYNQMLTTTNRSLVTQVTAGAESAMNQLRDQEGISSSDTAISMKSPEFYVPQLSVYPRWFVVTGQEEQGGVSFPGAFVLDQDQPGGPWREAVYVSDSVPPYTALPVTIATNGQGYATAVTAGSGLGLSPGELGAAYAQYLNLGPQPAPGFASGVNTSGQLSFDATFQSQANRNGWQVKISYVPAGWPVYALRTSDGGALVFYDVAVDKSWAATSSAAGFSDGILEPYMPSTHLAAIAGVSSARANSGEQLVEDGVQEAIGVIPPSGQGAITVTAYDGGGDVSVSAHS